MTSLEEKLTELGYPNASFEDRNIYYKWVNSTWRVAFEIDNETIKDVSIGIGTNNLHNDEEFYKDEELLQQAFNEMQKDLEELRKYESI